MELQQNGHLLVHQCAFARFIMHDCTAFPCFFTLTNDSCSHNGILQYCAIRTLVHPRLKPQLVKVLMVATDWSDFNGKRNVHITPSPSLTFSTSFLGA